MKKSRSITLVLIATAGINVALAKWNFDLESMRAASRTELEKPKAGDRLEPLEAQQLDGQKVILDFGPGRPTRVFFYFTTTCRYSVSQASRWREQLKRHGMDIRFYGLVSESEDLATLGVFLRQHRLSDLQVLRLSEEARKGYRLNLSPTTIVADGNGETVWSGVGFQPQLDLRSRVSTSRPASSLYFLPRMVWTVAL